MLSQASHVVQLRAAIPRLIHLGVDCEPGENQNQNEIERSST